MNTQSLAQGAQACDIFCSIGGLTYGMQRAGIAVKAGFDVDGSCRYAYEKNCKTNFVETDIRKISYQDISRHFHKAKHRILVGCAPCQPFSIHTIKMKLDHHDSRWTLINEFLRITLEGMPEIISMENVPQLRNQTIYIKFKQKLMKAGYHVSDDVLSCADFGVPQNRRRLVLLASLLGGIDMPKSKSVPPKTVRQTIGKLAHLQNGEASVTDPLHVCSGLMSINLKRIRASKPGGSWKDWPTKLLPECYKRPSGASYGSVYGRMQWDLPAPTLTTQFFGYGTGRYGHPEQDRALSLREGALLQTFPKQYEFVPPKEKVSLTTVGRHIGNAVPPSLATAIGKAILTHLEEKG